MSRLAPTIVGYGVGSYNRRNNFIIDTTIPVHMQSLPVCVQVFLFGRTI